MCKPLLQSLPPLLILFLLCYSYHIYVVLYCLYALLSPLKRILYLILYHFFLFLVLWSFLQTMLCNHKPIPDEYCLSSQEHECLLDYAEDKTHLILKRIISVRNLEVYTCTEKKLIRYCKLCHLIKPDRTHHCSSCNRCILKMDHHCPWVYNCVGFSNHKHFILLLLYATLFSAFIVGTIIEELPAVIQLYQVDIVKLQLGIGFLITVLTGTFTSILFIFHVSMVCRNQTTLEHLRDTTFFDGNATYDIGCVQNLKQVFGANCCLWWLPIGLPPGSGHEFPTRSLIPD